MIKQLFAALGMGSATIETRLASAVAAPGEPLLGSAVITGGSSDHYIERLSLFVYTTAVVKQQNVATPAVVSIGDVLLKQQISVKAGSHTAIPFRFKLPPNTPLTDLSRAGLARTNPALTVQSSGSRNRARVWIYSGLTVNGGFDDTDNDQLFVRPTGPQLAMLRALEKIGMSFQTSEVECGPLPGSRSTTKQSCYQELDYRPSFWGFAGLEELEVTFVPGTRSTKVLFQLDRRQKRDLTRNLTMQHATYEQIDWAHAVRQLLQT